MIFKIIKYYMTFLFGSFIANLIIPNAFLYFIHNSNGFTSDDFVRGMFIMSMYLLPTHLLLAILLTPIFFVKYLKIWVEPNWIVVSPLIIFSLALILFFNNTSGLHYYHVIITGLIYIYFMKKIKKIII